VHHKCVRNIEGDTSVRRTQLVDQGKKYGSGRDKLDHSEKKGRAKEKPTKKWSRMGVRSDERA